jgi:hypothetical protein
MGREPIERPGPGTGQPVPERPVPGPTGPRTPYPVNDPVEPNGPGSEPDYFPGTPGERPVEV